MKYLIEYKLFEYVKKTTDQFIEDAKKVHGDKYDYSKVDYKDAKTKVKIICPNHGEWEQLPNGHLQGYGCYDCGNEKIGLQKARTIQQFLEEAKKIHGDKYDYSLVDYKNAHTKVKIICPEHGEFQQIPDLHLRGNGCRKCSKKRGPIKLSHTRITKTTEQFIEDARRVHGDKYDYSKVDYKNALTKVKIICPEHGEFEQIPPAHITGSGCDKCGNARIGLARKLSTEDFIKKAKKVHGDKYDYSLADYKGYKTPLTIVCPDHGEFKQTPQTHISQGGGCQICGFANFLGSTKSNTKEFIEKAKEIHGNKYDYSKVDYEGSHKKVTIICPDHGEWEQLPGGHLRGYGCPTCSGNVMSNTEEFIKKANLVHGYKYDYSKVDYEGSHKKVTIICPDHGEFEQIPSVHITGRSGCPTCSESKGETIIRLYLNNNEIFFVRQKSFIDLIHKKRLKYDFYLIDYNICIEYDGRQHYEPYEKFGGIPALLLQQKKDKLKTEYCQEKDIKLIRIPYWEIKNIKTILDEELGL